MPAHDGLLTRTVRLLEARIEGLEEVTSNGLLWRGEERRKDATFSDEQVKRIKELFDERAEVHAGRAFFRLVLWVLGTVGVTTTTILVAFLKLKGG